jgi:hypothetical protein
MLKAFVHQIRRSVLQTLSLEQQKERGGEALSQKCNIYTSLNSIDKTL